MAAGTALLVAIIPRLAAAVATTQRLGVVAAVAAEAVAVAADTAVVVKFLPDS